MALPFAGKYVKVVEALGNAKSHKAVARELGAELIFGPVEFPEQTFVIFSEHGLYKRNEVVLPPQPDAHEQLLYITSVFLYNCKRAKQLLPLDPEYLCFQTPVFGNAIIDEVPEQEQAPASPVAEQEPMQEDEEEEEEVEVVEPPKRKRTQHAPKPNPKKTKRMQAVLNDSSSDDLSSSSSEDEEEVVVVKTPKYTSPPDSSEDEDEDLRRAKAAYEALLAKKGKPAAAAAASPALDVGTWKTHEQQSLRKFFEDNNHLSTYMLAKQAAETRVVNRSTKSIEPRIVQLRMTLQPEYVAGKHHATAEADNIMMRWAYLWNEEHPEDLCYGKRAWEALLDTGKVKDRTVTSLKKRWDHVVRTKFNSAPDEAFQAGKDLGETDVDAWGRA